ncbi:transposase [Streptomyces sp. NPDC000941]
MIEPHLPLGERGPIPDLRSYLLQCGDVEVPNGEPWRDVPRRYGCWSTIYDRFRVRED